MQRLAITFLLFASLLSSRAESFWHLKRVAGRDYLPFSDIAAFYQLDGDIQPVNSFITLSNDRTSLEASVDSRQIIVDGVKHWLGFPVLEIDGEGYISRIDLGKTLDPILRPTHVKGLSPFDTVVLDAGHGGKDHGATSKIILEKDLNLDVCKRLKSQLEQRGLTVVFTRNDDVFIPLQERAAIANQYHNAIFISVHFNYSVNGSEAEGFEIFALTPSGAPSTDDHYLLTRHMGDNPGNRCDTPNVTLATSIHHTVLGTMPRFDRGVKRARFAVLRLSKNPAVLVEGGFLSNGEDTKHATSSIWRENFAEAITIGIMNYRQLAIEGTRPKIAADYRKPRNTDFALSMPPEIFETLIEY